MYVGWRGVAVDDAQGDGKGGWFHRDQHGGQRSAGFIMNEDIVHADAILAKRDDFEFDRAGFDPQSLVSLSAKDEWLAVDHVDLVVRRARLVGETAERAVIVD